MTKTTTKSAKSKAPAKAAQPDGPEFRVVKLPKLIRQAIKDARIASGLNNEKVIAACVQAELPRLVVTLTRDLGFSSLTQPSQAFRLPFGEGVLSDLKNASEETGIPASHLLIICLASLSSVQLTKTRNPRTTKKGGK